MGDGAFSNVYKAIERKTGRKVAVKVVRKYELNSSQVSDDPARISVYRCSSFASVISHALARHGVPVAGAFAPTFFSSLIHTNGRVER